MLLFYRWGNGSKSRVNNLPKVIQLVCGGAGLWTQAARFSDPSVWEQNTTRQLRIPWQHPCWITFSACIPNLLPSGSVIPCPLIHHLSPVTVRGWCPLHRILWALPELQSLRKHLENNLCCARRERQSQRTFRVVLSPLFLLLIQEGVEGGRTDIFSSSLSNFLKHQADMQKAAFSDANFSLNHGSFKTTRWSIENAWQFL